MSGAIVDSLEFIEAIETLQSVIEDDVEIDEALDQQDLKDELP